MDVAILWLVNERGEILLSQRATHVDSDAGVWGPSVSGKVEEGEEPEEAAVRETQEELGIDPQILSPIHLHDEIHNHSDGRLRKFSIFYSKINKNTSETMNLDPNEVASTKWISLDDFQTLFSEDPASIIISSATKLWEDIFTNLRVAVS